MDSPGSKMGYQTLWLLTWALSIRPNIPVLAITSFGSPTSGGMLNDVGSGLTNGVYTIGASSGIVIFSGSVEQLPIYNYIFRYSLKKLQISWRPCLGWRNNAENNNPKKWNPYRSSTCKKSNSNHRSLLSISSICNKNLNNNTSPNLNKYWDTQSTSGLNCQNNRTYSTSQGRAFSLICHPNGRSRRPKMET